MRTPVCKCEWVGATRSGLQIAIQFRLRLEQMLLRMSRSSAEITIQPGLRLKLAVLGMPRSGQQITRLFNLGV